MKSHARLFRRQARHLHRPLAFAVALALGMPLAGHAAELAANALPTGQHGISGRITIPDPHVSTNPATGGTTTTLTITQQSRGAAVSWNSFNIGKDAVVEIRNPTWGRQSVTLNRVTGAEPSQIFGKLIGDGSIFLINPQGITFAPGSSVNVGSLVASTLGYGDTNADFVNAVDRGEHRFSFTHIDGDPYGDLVTQSGEGDTPAAGITANGGMVALFGGNNVANGGSITADGGKVAFGSADQITLDLQGDGLTMLTIDLPGRGVPGIANTGTIQADGGEVVMRLDALQPGAFVVNSGTIRARSLRNSGGRIILDAAPGTTYKDVPIGGGDTTTYTGNGGTVTVTGTLDASAATTGVAGGSITVSGDRLQISGDDVSLDAGGNGAANGTLDLISSASMLVSGKDTLALQPGNGQLDRYSLILDSALGDALSHDTDVSLRSLGRPGDSAQGHYDGSIWFMDGAGTDNDADNDGEEDHYPSARIDKVAGGPARLLVQANRDIYMLGGSSISSSSGSLDVDFDADHAGKDGAQQYDFGYESGGQITMAGASILSNGGSVLFHGQGDPEGRATGSRDYLTDNPADDPVPAGQTHRDGIRLLLSTIDTCVRVGDACNGSGSVNLRGLGVDDYSGSPLLAGSGLNITSSILSAGSGGVTLDGEAGGIGHGVMIAPLYAPDRMIPGSSSVLRSTGSITINGQAGSAPDSWDGSYPTDLGSGVAIAYAQILADGDLIIHGDGGDFSALLDSADPDDAIAASNGIMLAGTTLHAGNGRALTLDGHAGSAGQPGISGNVEAATPAAIRIVSIPDTTEVRTSISAAGGRIDIGGNGDIHLQNSSLDVSSANGDGGAIQLQGDNILLGAATSLDASGSGNAGQVTVTAQGIAAMDATASMFANAGNGRGGMLSIIGNGGLRAYGSLTAHGNGSLIETSGGFIDLRGIRIDGGSWLIDPYDIEIVNGTATGSLDSNPFTPMLNSTIQDGDINQALNSGSSVTITTGDPATGTANGNITIHDDVLIDRTMGTDPLLLSLQAHGAISGSGFTIRSSSGALAMDFDSDADGPMPNGTGGIDFDSMTLQSNGGDIRMFGQHDAINGYAGGIRLGADAGSIIDTRVGGSDTGAAGNLLLRGQGQSDPFSMMDGIVLQGGDAASGLAIHTGQGDIDMIGRGNNGGNGITLQSADAGGVQLATSSGHIHLNGFGSATVTDGSMLGNSSHGLFTRIGINGGPVILQTGSGDIDLRAHGPADSDDGNATMLPHDGLYLGAGTRVISQSGNILLSGTSEGSAAGIELAGGLSSGSTAEATLIDAGSGRLVLRAHNDTASLGNALAIGSDLILRSSDSVNIRPGGVDNNGNLVENPQDAITIGALSSFAGGINLSTGNLAQIETPVLILGSNIQAGDVTVSNEAGDIAFDGNLTLYAAGGGDVRLDGGTVDVGTHALALVADGVVSQAGAIIAGELLAMSGNASVLLANGANQVAAQTVAGSAAGDFTFHNSGDLGVGTVNATGFSAGTNAPDTLTASGINAGGDVLLYSLGGNLLLNDNVQGAMVDLVTGPSGVFLNPAGASVQADNGWHVWASSWVGEDRGGLAGNGNLPNLYGCTYGGTCAVTPTANAHQFIYTQQPVATIDLADSSRQYGLPNGTLDYTVSGMILGDLASNAISGTPSTSATQASHVGSYAVGGNFTSPAGYLMQVNPGTLAITPATLTYVADPYSRIYGDPNGVLGGQVTGFLLGDTLASATTGTLAFASNANQTSGVGSYAINGSGLSATDYVFVQDAANATAMTITPATLTYVANPYSRTYGDLNGALGGTITGFRMGDTLADATTGTLAFASNASQASNVGSYAINGSGLNATNYVFVQDAANATAFTITPATLTYVADPYSRIYGDPNGVLGGTVTGFRMGDTLADATTGTLAFSSNASQASNVGSYAINGSGLDAINYIFAQDAANDTALTITPATLTYVATPHQRLVGLANGVLDGKVVGFRNGDTLASATTGKASFDSPADINSPVGQYGIFGSGLSARNYVFVQDSGNAVALQILPLTTTYSLDFQRDPPVTYVYDRNFGITGLCPATDLASSTRDKDGDPLAREWSRVRSRPNLANCVSTRQNNSCGNF